MDRSEKKCDGNKRKNSFLIFLIRAIPNICIVLSVMSLTFLIINIFNKPMHFVDSELSCTVFMASGVVSLLTSIISICYERKMYSMQNKGQDNYSGTMPGKSNTKRKNKNK